MSDLKDEIEPGIWPLVEAANESGYPTISSCEGHPDERVAAVVFIANNDDALRVHLALLSIRADLLCSWQLTAGFLRPIDRWVLAWKLENWGVKNTPAQEHDTWCSANTEAGQSDAIRLAALFRATTLSQRGN